MIFFFKGTLLVLHGYAKMMQNWILTKKARNSENSPTSMMRRVRALTGSIGGGIG